LRRYAQGCHFDKRQRGEIYLRFEKDFSLPLEMTNKKETG
jgi:hypothetical protein